tara:strand:- start:3813 stop:5900 length:2088 start_codon:yes stop_codon:yes gene_type:complete
MANGDENNLENQKKVNQAKSAEIKLTQETKKELLSQREALNQILKLQKESTEQKRETVGLSRDLAKLAADEVLYLEKSDKFLRSEKDLVKRILQDEELRNELELKKDSLSGAAKKNLQAQLNTSENISAQLQDQLDKRKQLNKDIGISDNILRGLEQIPFLKEFIDGEEAIAATEEAILNAGESADKTAVGMKATLGNVFQQLKDSSKDIGQAIDAWGMKKSGDLAVTLFHAMLELSEQTVKVQKSLSLSNDEALDMNHRLQSLAMNARNGVVNINDMRDSLVNINEQLGIATSAIKDDIVTEMAILAKTTGLSAEAQGRFAQDAIMSGKNAHEITKATRETVQAQIKQFGLGVNVNKVLDEAGQITGVMAANFGFSIERMAKALTLSKQLGISLEQTKGIQSGMLDFQTSIENELAAELFTGKQLNLEKARLYALTNDYSNLQKEIAKQFPSVIEFEKMNYFAKERTAAALGLTADGMADILRDGRTNADLAKEAADAGEDLLAEEYEKLSVAEQLQASQDKIVSSLTTMMTNMLPLIDGMAKLATYSGVIYTAMAAFAVIKFAQMFLGLRGMLRLLTMSAAAATTTAGMLTLGLGVVVIGGIIAAAIASQKSTIESSAVSKNDLSPMDVAQIQKGEVKAHSGESLIRTNTLEALISKLGGGNQQQNMQPVVLSVNYSGFDAVKAPTHYKSSIR